MGMKHWNCKHNTCWHMKPFNSKMHFEFAKAHQTCSFIKEATKVGKDCHIHETISSRL